MSDIAPVRVGLLFDYIEEGRDYDENIIPTFQYVIDDFRERGEFDRPVELVIREVQGLPNGSFRAVRDAWYELVEEDCLVVYGPWVSENGVPLAKYINADGGTPMISMAASESMLGEWVFALPAGSQEEEPIILAAVAAYDGCQTIGIVYEDSLIGEEYLRATREACKRRGLRVTGEVATPQVMADQTPAMTALAAGKPDGIIHVGFGLALAGMNDALDALGWHPHRYTCTAFEFASSYDFWREQLAGWVGLDQYDERNPVAQEFIERFDALHGRRLDYYMPLYCYDVARVILTALSTARPLTGNGMKDALERVKLLPAATGAPGTRMRFGKFIRQGFVGSEFLVARRVLDDGSKVVMHGTIEGLVGPVDRGPSR